MEIEEIIKFGSVIILSLLVLYIVFLQPTQPKVEKVDAENFVLQDLKAKYSNADKISIVETREKENYYEIVARVTFDYYTKCPRRIHLYYLYPKQGFEPQPPEHITKNCEVHDLPIAFEEEAIIKSWRENPIVEGFIDSFGAEPAVSRIQGGWEVTWLGNAPYYYKVIVNETGETEVFTIQFNQTEKSV
ncbi:MAG: hypothetical protein QXL47_03860 [Candidatus Anstonellales archaeon]